jgi:hypothetical protein
MVQGSKAAQKDTTGSIAIMKQKSDYKSKDLAAMIPLTLKALVSPKGVKTGCFSTADWSAFGAWMLKNKLLKQAIPATAIQTNAYLSGC